MRSEFRVFVRTDGRGIQAPPADAVTEYFGECGEIVDIYHPKASPDICFVQFRTEEAMNVALWLPIATIGDTVCTVSQAAPREQTAAKNGGDVQKFPGLSSGAAPTAMRHVIRDVSRTENRTMPAPAEEAVTKNEFRVFVRAEGRGIKAPPADAVTDYFGECGEIVDIYHPKTMPDICFVQFRTEEAMNVALWLPIATIGDVQCSVTQAAPREQAAARNVGDLQKVPAHAGGAAIKPRRFAFRVFIRTEARGIPAPTAEEIREYFDGCGDIVDIYHPKAMPDICFVSFGNEEEMTAALWTPTASIGGTVCSVAQAAPREQSAAKGAGGVANVPVQARPATSEAPAVVDEGKPRVYVSGIDLSQTDENDLQMYFSAFGVVRDIYMPVDGATGLKKPFAFVTMATKEEQALILSQSEHTIADDVTVNVAYAAPRESKNAGAAPAQSSTAPIHGVAAPISPIQQAATTAHKLCVAGMPTGLNADMLRGHFAVFGEITDISIPPQSPEMGYVSFSTASEVQNAVDNSGIRIAGFWVKGVHRIPALQTAKGDGKGFERFRPY